MQNTSLIILTIITLIVVSWLFRYELVGSERASYMLDRWDGSVHFIIGKEIYEVKKKTDDTP